MKQIIRKVGSVLLELTNFYDIARQFIERIRKRRPEHRKQEM